LGRLRPQHPCAFKRKDGAVDSPYYGYPSDFKFNYRLDVSPSPLFTEILKPCLRNGKEGFEFLGRVRPPVSGEGKVSEPFCTPYAVDLIKRQFPELLDGKNIVKTKYMLTAKYPRAEYTSMSRYANDFANPKEGAWNAACVMLSEAYKCMGDSEIADIDVAIDWLERQTSPGYPWTLRYLTKDKIVDSQWFKPWYQRWESALIEQKDCRTMLFDFLFKAFIKDEPKKREDVEKHNPRTILASPIQGSVLSNRLFADMNNKLTLAGSYLSVPCFVGVKKFNRMWHELFLYLNVFPNKAHGDCTRFDGTVSPNSFMSIANFRASCLNNENYKSLIYWYYDQMCNSVIVGSCGDLFRKFMGQPSGQGNTLHDNSLIHTLYWFYHWCTKVVVSDPIKFQSTWESFQKFVRLMVMGDDVVWSYSNEVKALMSPEAVTATFLELKVYLKAEYAPRYEDLEFCSMHWVIDGGIFVPLMKREKMVASLLIKSNMNVRTYLRRVVSIRTEVWWDPYLRRLCNSLVTHLLDNYSHELRRKPIGTGGDDADFDTIMTLYLTPQVISDHYKTPSI
jgi:hypothetical protein